MNLSAPTMPVFIISFIIAVLGILDGAGIFSIVPLQAFWMVTIGYLILLAGNLLKGF